MDDRIHWIDYAKGISIFLVVYAHVTFGLHRAGIMEGCIFNAPFMIIAVNTMPWFFFLSGLFFSDSLKKRGPLGIIANRIDTIFYPYIIWSIVQGIIEFAFSQWTNNQLRSLSEVFSLLWQPRAQLWFLYVLFFINVIVILMTLFIKNRIIILLLSLLAYITCASFHFEYPVFKQILGYLFYFVLALYVKDYLSRLYELRQILILPLTICVVAIHWFFFTELQTTKQLHGSWQFMINLISLPFIVVLTMNFSKRIPFLLLLGRHSMVIYLLHIIAGSGTRIVLQKVFNIDNLYIHLIAGMTAGIFVPLIVYRVFEHMRLSLFFRIPQRISSETAIKGIKTSISK